MDLTIQTIDDQSEEAAQAKLYWAKPDTQPLHYDHASHYAIALAELILLTGCRNVFEFGCAAGRNLAVIRGYLSDHVGHDVALSGIDINPESIQAGRETYQLELAVGDEESLSDWQADAVDFVFTVSVLDHLPDPRRAIDGMLRMTRRYAVFLEPCDLAANGGREGKIEHIASEWAGGKGGVTPFTYLHDYPSLFRAAGADLLLAMPLPTHLNKAGPLYRLFILQKDARTESPNADELRNRLGRASTLQLLRTTSALRTESIKLKREAEQVQHRLKQDVARAQRRWSEAQTALVQARRKGEASVK